MFLLKIGKNRFSIMVYINKISKNIFPLYIPPFNDELFSSYIFRLSINHQVKPHSFIANYSKFSNVYWNRDIDLLAPSHAYIILDKHTPIEKERIDNLFLNSLESYAFENVNYNSFTLNIIPIGVKYTTRKKNGQLFCPSCLSKEKYYKKKWRLMTSLVCVDCECLLIDNCPNCNNPITYYRNNMGSCNPLPNRGYLLPLSYCSNCEFDFTLSKLTKASDNLITYQKFIDTSIENGFNDVTHYSFLFIKGLLVTAQRLASTRKKNPFKEIVQKEFNYNIDDLNKIINLWSFEERLKILPIAFDLLYNNKEILIEVIARHRLGKTYISDSKKLPFWFDNFFNY